MNACIYWLCIFCYFFFIFIWISIQNERKVTNNVSKRRIETRSNSKYVKLFDDVQNGGNDCSEIREASGEYRRFLKSLALPINQSCMLIYICPTVYIYVFTVNIDHENDDDNDSEYEMKLDDTILPNESISDVDNDYDMNNINSLDNNVLLNNDQIIKIKELIKIHFQMLIQLRHLIYDETKWNNEYIICNKMLKNLYEYRHKSMESIKKSLIPMYCNYNHPLTRQMKNNINKNVIKNLKVSTAFDITEMNKYAKFNENGLKSLDENIIHLNLNKKYIPKISENTGTKISKIFTKEELILFDMGIKQYGSKLSPNSDVKYATNGSIIPDWKRIQSRYLPMRAIHSLQSKLQSKCKDNPEMV